MSLRTKDGRSTRWHSFRKDRFEHGTVARYVSGCRCPLCRKALNDKAHARAMKVRELAPTIEPNGPPGARALLRTDPRTGEKKRHQIKTCPGTGGKPCVRGGAWLKDAAAIGSRVCLACVARATIWNGLVAAKPARAHLLAMRDVGIGYKTVASAADVAASLCHEIIKGKVKRVRAQTLRRIIATAEGCRTDGCRIPAAPTRKLVMKIFALGFTHTWLSRQLGNTVYIGGARRWSMAHVKASTALKVEKLWRRIKAGELEPRPRWVAAAPSLRRLREMLEGGATRKEIEARLSYPVDGHTMGLTRMRPETQEKIAALYQEWKANEGELSRPQYDDRLSIDDFAEARLG